MTIHKSAPREIQVGKPAVFRVTVRNTGLTAAAQVEIRDRVPRGTRLLGTSPQAKRDANGELAWTLGTIRSGEEAFVEMQVMPLTEGEIGSVATVHFGADASVRTVATRPQLAVETSAPGQVLIGEQVMLTITVSNPGTGVATNVVLAERIPRGLQHPAGGELEYTVGNLKPGESRRLDLPLMAKRPGPVTNRLVARADGNLRAVAERELEVLAPQLNIVMEGSKKRFLERQATYQVSVANSGTAPARQVELAVLLPPGLKFLSANNAGRFDEATRVVHWRLEELPAKETGSVELRTMPVAAGQHAIRLRGTAEKGLLVEKEHPVTIDGIANAQFQVINVNNPVAVGDETVYEVHVTNQGSKAAANVRLDVLFPPELKPLAAEGPTRYALDAGRVVFDGLAQIAPKRRGGLSHPRQGPQSRRCPRPLPTVDRRNANAADQGRENAGVCRRLGIESTFTSVPDVAQSMYPLLPVRLLAKTQLNSAAKIANYHGPLLQSHGTADRLIPCSIGRKLFDRANEPKQFVTIAGGDHNDPQTDEYYAILAAFLDRLK